MASITGSAIVTEVRKFLGDPYVYGAAGPSSFDCSGLVQYALEQLGMTSVPRTSEAQWGWVKKISQSQLQPGDLIFEQWPGDSAAPGHVVIYIGGGQIIQAPETGQDVSIASWSPQSVAKAGGTVVGYGRVPNVAASGTSASSTGGGSGLLSLFLPQDVLDMFSTAEDFLKGIMWILNPENWMRIIAGAAGVLLAGAGILFIIKAA